MLTIPQAEYGIASFQNEDVVASPELFAGDTPQVVTISGVASAAIRTSGLPRWTPVYVAHDGAEIQLPAEADGETPAIVANAITVGSIAANAPSGSRMPVYQAGCFNIEAINWDASLATDAEKFAAINSPTIVIKYRG